MELGVVILVLGGFGWVTRDFARIFKGAGDGQNSMCIEHHDGSKSNEIGFVGLCGKRALGLFSWKLIRRSLST